jgi:hypothetical protein
MPIFIFLFLEEKIGALLDSRQGGCLKAPQSPVVISRAPSSHRDADEAIRPVSLLAYGIVAAREFLENAGIKP